MQIPDGLAWLNREPGGAAWLAELPRRIDTLARRWGLVVEQPFEGSNVSWVAPARRGDEPVVLKLQWPHDECEHEAAALVAWDGDAAVELLAHDAGLGGLLLERCTPGTELSRRPGIDPLGVMVELLPRLWKPTDEPFPTLEGVSTRWAVSMLARWEEAGRPCERRLVDVACSLIAELATTQGPQVLVHQDLHGENVLAAGRAPWLVIDPKPVVGEREFSCAPIVRAFEFGATPQATRSRLDRLCVELGLDHHRARGWTIAHTMAWSFSSAYMDQHHATVRALLDAAPPRSRQKVPD